MVTEADARATARHHLVTMVVIVICGLPGVSADAGEEPIKADELARFLRQAEVVEVERYESLGITKPHRAVLRDGHRTMRAVFKDYHEYKPVKVIKGEERITRFRDSYLHEAAAYELSEFLGLGVVPPTVVRKVGSHEGSLQLWLDGAMTERERSERRISPPDPIQWSRELGRIKVFMQLTWDMDHKNVSNIMIMPDFRLYKVDNSRAFRWVSTLRAPEALNRFPRRLHLALKALDREALRERMAPYLEDGQVDALLARCDAMLALIEARIAERGETGVLF